MIDGIPIQGRVYTRDGQWYLSLDMPQWAAREVCHQLDSPIFRIVNSGRESMMMVQVKDTPSPDAALGKAIREFRRQEHHAWAEVRCQHSEGEEPKFLVVWNNPDYRQMPYATKRYRSVADAIDEYNERKG